MHVQKKVIAQLNKCYALSELTYQGRHCFLVAAEKSDPCLLFDEDGTQLDTVWEEPGGAMTLVPVPGTEGQFLATHRFYSPNDGASATIVWVRADDAGGWQVQTLAVAPFVHRFGVLSRGGVNYLLVCCLKTGHEHRDDWRFAGACFAAELPADLSAYDAANPLPLTLVKDGMLKNHGFAKVSWGGHDAGLVGCEQGTFLFEPPAVRGADWQVTCLLDVPSSDSVLMDFDGDGKPELGVISPFHGNALTVFHLDGDGRYVPQWKYPAPERDTEMIHATWACSLCGVPTWIVGWRKGTRETIAITWDEAAGTYATEFIDRQTGAANVLHFVNARGEDVVVAANREIDEIALYTITK